MNDAGSLQNLNDIVVPGPVAWWPLAPAWYVLAAVLLAIITTLAVHRWRNWRQNRYRRQSMIEFSLIRAGAGPESLRQLPGLLKRTALSAWPREEVASLSGQSWHRFLDQSAGMDLFCSGAGETLDQLAYTGGGAPAVPGPELSQVLDAAETWLKTHLRQAQTG
jgi:hypothetical protein